MADTERIEASDHPAAAWFRKDVELIETELLAVLRKHWPNVGSQVVAHALIQTVGSVLITIMDAEPLARADILTKVEQWHLFLATDGQRPQ